MISTFPRNPQRDDCYYFQPGISHPEWINLGEQVVRSDLRKPRIGRPFAPKNSGLPKGTLHKKTKVGIEICRAMAGHAADRLAQLVDSRSPRIAFEATRLVLAYAWGAPRQTVEVSGAFGDFAKEISLALANVRERRAERDALAATPEAPILSAVISAADPSASDQTTYASQADGIVRGVFEAEVIDASGRSTASGEKAVQQSLGGSIVKVEAELLPPSVDVTHTILGAPPTILDAVTVDERNPYATDATGDAAEKRRADP